MPIDIINSMTTRLAEIRKADSSIRSDEQARARLASSRHPADQELWRGYKDGVVLSSSVTKDDNPDAALRAVTKRCDELIAADPCGTRSRQSALAKIATSRDPADQALWQRFKTSGAVLVDDVPSPLGRANAA